MKKRIIEIAVLFTIAIVVFVTSSVMNYSRKEDVPTEEKISEIESQDLEGNQNEHSSQSTSESSEQLICVYICGAIKNPGVYYLPLESRLNDAVILAGGMLPEANAEGCNLAEILTDGRKIRIPYQGEEVSFEAYSYDENGLMEDEKVNINTANEDELTTIPGIGQTRAEAIVAYRKKHGDFKSVEEIMNVSGIKEGLFLKISPYIKI